MLAPWEAHVLAAATPVLTGVSSVDGLVVAANVDRFLVTMPRAVQLEIHQLLGLVEHGTTPLGLRLSRFTRLPPDAREAFLLSLNARGGLMAQAFRGLRDLVLMGVYQDARRLAWNRLRGAVAKGVLGPENDNAKYESFRAPSGRGSEERGRADVIFDASTRALPLKLSTDLVVVGSGAGRAWRRRWPRPRPACARWWSRAAST